MAPMDPRRPRIPVELAGRVDEWRGNTPYERAVRTLIEFALRQMVPEREKVVHQPIVEAPVQGPCPSCGGLGIHQRGCPRAR